MNKTIKIRLNYVIGITLSLLLAWVLYRQVQEQLLRLEGHSLVFSTHYGWFALALVLGVFNILLEVWKWQYLVTRSDHITFRQAFKSYLIGLSLSFITPNRVGEYPGRLLVLEKRNTVRLLSLSILGAFAQMFITILMGNAGLLFYAETVGSEKAWMKAALFGNLLLTLLLALFFFRFEFFSKKLEGIKALRKYFTYRKIVQRMGTREQLNILGLSLLRYCIFTAELLALLYFFDVQIPIAKAILLSTLFFWAMTVVPTIALAELGIRGQVAIWLFGLYSQNVIGILLATFMLWLINLVFPAAVGGILLLRKKWLT